MTDGLFRYKRQHGFTLLEVLIVMIIVGILIGASTIMLKRDHQDLLQQDADRLLALIALAKDEAVFQARSLGLYFSDRSYVFIQQNDDSGQQGWSTMGEKQFRRRELSPTVKVALFRDETEINLLDQDKIEPQIFLLPTGEVTPFKVELTVPAKAKLTLTVDGLGQAEVQVNETF